MSDFPTDDVTLDILISACAVDPVDGRSHLFDVLDFGDIHYSPHQVIARLAEEIKRIRHDDDTVDDASFHKGYDLGFEHGKAEHLKEAEHATSKDAQVVSFEHDDQCEREWVTGSWGGAWSACGCAARATAPGPEGSDRS